MRLFREESEKRENLCLYTLWADGQWTRMGNRMGPRGHNRSDNWGSARPECTCPPLCPFSDRITPFTCTSGRHFWGGLRTCVRASQRGPLDPALRMTGRCFCYCHDPWVPVCYMWGSHVLSPNSINFAPSAIWLSFGEVGSLWLYRITGLQLQPWCFLERAACVFLVL